jgi:hypothetical protein
MAPREGREIRGSGAIRQSQATFVAFRGDGIGAAVGRQGGAVQDDLSRLRGIARKKIAASGETDAAKGLTLASSQTGGWIHLFHPETVWAARRSRHETPTDISLVDGCE